MTYKDARQTKNLGQPREGSALYACSAHFGVAANIHVECAVVGDNADLPKTSHGLVLRISSPERNEMSRTHLRNKVGEYHLQALHLVHKVQEGLEYCKKYPSQTTSGQCAVTSSPKILTGCSYAGTLLKTAEWRTKPSYAVCCACDSGRRGAIEFWANIVTGAMGEFLILAVTTHVSRSRSRMDLDIPSQISPFGLSDERAS